MTFAFVSGVRPGFTSTSYINTAGLTVSETALISASYARMAASPLSTFIRADSQYGETSVSLFKYDDAGVATYAINSNADDRTDGNIYIGFERDTLTNAVSNPDFIDEILFHEFLHSNGTVNAVRDSAVDAIFTTAAASGIPISAANPDDVSAVQSALEHFLIGQLQALYATEALSNPRPLGTSSDYSLGSLNARMGSTLTDPQFAALNAIIEQQIKSSGCFSVVESGDQVLGYSLDLSDIAIIRDVNGDGDPEILIYEGTIAADGTYHAKVRTYDAPAGTDIVAEVALWVSRNNEAEFNVVNPEGSDNGPGDGRLSDDIEEIVFDDLSAVLIDETTTAGTLPSASDLSDIVTGAAGSGPIGILGAISAFFEQLFDAIESLFNGRDVPIGADFAISADTLVPQGGVLIDLIPETEAIAVLNKGLTSQEASEVLSFLMGIDLDEVIFLAYTFGDLLSLAGIPDNSDVKIELITPAGLSELSQVIDGDDLIIVIDNGDGTSSQITLAGAVVDGAVTGVGPITLADGSSVSLGDIPVGEVTPPNAAPVSVADEALELDQEQSATTVDVLANDTDAEDETISISGSPSAANGTVVDNGDGTLTYTPNDGFFGTDVISYEITDGTNVTTASLDVTVNERDYIVKGTEGNDTLDGTYVDTDSDVVTDSDDMLEGLGGDDLLEGGAGADNLNGGDGTDTAGYASATEGVTANLADVAGNTGDAAGDIYVSIENLSGSGFDDTLTGDASDNILSGGAGDDLLVGGAGFDILDGGAGSDGTSYAAATAGVTVNLADNSQNTGAAAGDSYVDLENVTGSAFADVLTGDNANNVLAGGEGNDLLDGGEGADEIDGGADRDRLTYATAATAVAVSLSNNVLNAGAAAGDVITNVEDLTGSLLHDTLEGSDEANDIAGLDGDDVINGLGGNDALAGGAGNDTVNGGDDDDVLSGGAGADALNGGDGIDVASFADATEGLTIDLRFPWRSTGDANGDTFTSIEGLEGTEFNDRLYGDNGDNILIGNGGNDLLSGRRGSDTLEGGDGNDRLWGGGDHDDLSGGAGDDYLNGGWGNDVLAGGAGADRLVGGAGRDTADYSTSSEGVSIDLGGSGWGWWSTGPTAFGGDAQGDRLYSIENITGSANADTLTGDRGANVLAGGAGDDMLTGGRGQDTFVFNTGDGADTVTDFDSGNSWCWWHTPGDAIQLDVAGITNINDVLNVATQNGHDVALNFGNGDVLTLEDTALNTLGADDFVFA